MLQHNPTLMRIDQSDVEPWLCSCAHPSVGVCSQREISMLLWMLFLIEKQNSMGALICFFLLHCDQKGGKHSFQLVLKHGGVPRTDSFLAVLSYLSYTAQAHLPRDGTAYIVLGPPTPVTSHGNHTQIRPKVNLIWAVTPDFLR